MTAGGLLAALLGAVALFAGTNADDIVVLTVLNISSRSGGRPRRWQIWAGQYAGFTVLVGASLAAAAGLSLVPGRWLWVLALPPLGLGLHKLAAAVRARKSPEPPSPVVVSGLAGVMLLTIVNGGDNISVYVPVFRTATPAGIALTVAVFMAGTALYCTAGFRLAAQPAVTRLISRRSQWIVPAVFILIGAYILLSAGARVLTRPAGAMAEHGGDLSG
jgi:cadmium resistance protein CadD (predicted permease)